MLRVYLSQNENNDKVGVLGNWYLRADNNPPIGLEELADLIKEHNIGFSKGSIMGILRDMVDIVHGQVLNGQPVKIDGLAIFKASIENRGGWADLKDVSLRIGGEKDNVQAIRLLAQATGDFTKAELSKDGRLVLDRQSSQMVKAAGGNPDGGSSDDDGETTTGAVLTITKTGEGSMNVADQSGHQVDSGSQVAEGQTLTLTVTPAEGQTPTAALNGTPVTLTSSDGHYTGSFQMPAAASTLTVNTGFADGDNTE